MSLPLEYQKIAFASIAKDETGIREALSNGVDYKFAQAIMEMFYDNDEASKLIHKIAHCNCGNVATKFTDISICGGCLFSNAMKQIGYGTLKSPE